MPKTYNSGYSLVVTHLTTNPPVRCLNRAERTGSLVFNVLWSYVEVNEKNGVSNSTHVELVLSLNHQHMPDPFEHRRSTLYTDLGQQRAFCAIRKCQMVQIEYSVSWLLHCLDSVWRLGISGSRTAGEARPMLRAIKFVCYNWDCCILVA